MIRGIEFHEIIDNIFHNDVRGINESEQLQTNCPKCQEKEGLSYPDGKYNLEINTAKRVFRCWKCDEPKFAGSLGRLIKTLGSDLDYEVYKSYASVFIDYDNYEDEKEFVKVSLPQEIIFFSQMNPNDPEHYEAYNYLVNERLITRDIILKFRLGFCIEGKYAGRIIVPSYDEDGEVNFFIGRSYRKSKYPYLMPKVNKGLFIFNEGHIDWDSTVYLVEGVFEMLSFPINTIPLLGKDLLDALYFKLKNKKPNVVIILDPDAYKSAIDLFFKVRNIYSDEEERVKVVKLPNNDDLDELRKKRGMDEILKAVKTAKKLSTEDYFMKRLYAERKYTRRYQTY